MIAYGEAPSRQLGIPGLGADGEALMEAAREWVREHPEAFEVFKATARDAGEASPNLCIQVMRATCKVSVRNAFSPAFARIAMEQEPTLRFRLARSKVDAFTEADI